VPACVRAGNGRICMHTCVRVCRRVIACGSRNPAHSSSLYASSLVPCLGNETGKLRCCQTGHSPYLKAWHPSFQLILPAPH